MWVIINCWHCGCLTAIRTTIVCESFIQLYELKNIKVNNLHD